MISWVPKKTINHARVQEILKDSIASNLFTNGSPAVRLLEQTARISLDIENTKSVICVSNGTAALWAAVAGFELFYQRKLHFFTQSFTFPASAQGYLDEVTIVDNDHEGGLDLSLVNIDACDGIIVTNVFGNLVNIKKYTDWGTKYNKIVLFDNAAAAYSIYNTKNACNYGMAATLSFHHTKPIGFGEGGCIIVDSKYENSIRRIINFGIDNKDSTSKWSRFGGNYKMSDLQAAYIIQYMERIPEIIAYTRDLYSYFLNKISNISHIKVFSNFSDSIPFVSCISIFIPNSTVIMDILLKNNIYCRKYYNPLLPTPNAMELYDKIICIPCNIDMNHDDIDRIIDIISRKV